MKAFVSGQAALAVIMERPAQVRPLDGPAKIFAATPPNALRLFEGCTDVREIEISSYEELDKEVEIAWAKDRALRFVIMLFDVRESAASLSEYADCLEELLIFDGVASFASQAMLVRPINVIFEVNKIRAAIEPFAKVTLLVEYLIRCQELITKVKSTFEEIFDQSLAKNERVSLWDEFCVDGHIAAIVQHLHDQTDMSFTRMTLASRYIRFRTQIGAWTARLQSFDSKLTSSSVLLMSQSMEKDEDYSIRDMEAEERSSSYEAFKQVRLQQFHIVELLKQGQIEKARTFTDQLIASQRAQSTKAQIAKSLCYLAQQAKLHDVPEMHLEWARNATFENPADPITFGHMAEALLIVGKAYEAGEAFKRAIDLGEGLFGKTGLARIKRYQGAAAEAREEFINLAKVYDGAEGVEHTLMAAAECLRDMGRSEEAVAEYRELTIKYPLDSTLWSGLAGALLDIGSVSEALSVLGKAEVNAKNALILADKAKALAILGSFPDARVQYKKVLDSFPNNQAALCGIARIAVLEGKLSEAVHGYEVAIERSPYSSKAYAGLATSLIEMYQFERAEAVLAQAATKCHDNQHLAYIGIKLLKKMGKFGEALMAAEKMRRMYPFSVSINLIRLSLLWDGMPESDMLASYEDLRQKNPYSVRVALSEARYLISKGRYSNALALLSDSRPKTSRDWDRFVLATSAFEALKGVGFAKKQFEWGLINCVFFRQKKAMRSLLISMSLKEGKVREAKRLVEVRPVEVSNIIAFHTYWLNKQDSKARGLLQEIRKADRVGDIISLAKEIEYKAKRHDAVSSGVIASIAVKERDIILAEVA